MSAMNQMIAILKTGGARENDDFHVYPDENAITVKSSGDENVVTLFKFSFDNESLCDVRPLPEDGNLGYRCVEQKVAQQCILTNKAKAPQGVSPLRDLHKHNDR